ncbi:MAG: hypothetical protein CMF74_15270 [Maricaulis sp.]|mgnify:CR=1 FL=1|nr:hypothetical protein [Maricaulis sp.]HAQ33953.1 hypothetical protein [Alphaproteobacteria bacterium]
MFRTTTMAAAAALLTAAGAFADDMFAGVRSIEADGGQSVIEFNQLQPDVMDMQPGERVDLNFAGDLEAELDRITVGNLGARTWVGRIAGQDIRSRVILTETNGFVFGQINTPDGTWNIVPAVGGGHQIFQHHPDATVPEWGDDGIETGWIPGDVIEHSPLTAEDPSTGQAVAVGSNGTIDIAAYYTQSMVDLWGLAVGGRVQFLVALLDQAHIDSDTGMRARLVNLEFLAADEAPSNSNTLGDLQDGVGDNTVGANGQDFRALRTTRDSKGADLVTIIRHYNRNTHGSCGVAYVLGGGTGTITSGSAGFGVSVNSDWIDVNWSGTGGYSFCTDQTFAHEIGHNTGFAHNRANAGSAGVRPFAYGHRVDGQFRTIMSYSSGTGESRVNYFSNPDITLCPGGAACGIADPSASSADNARAAREEGRNITEFRPVAPRVVSAVLPVTRSVLNGNAATAFATVINPAANASTATGCGLRLAGASASQFSYQTTNSSNALTGTANTPVDIAAGAAQNFVFSVTSATNWANNNRSAIASDNDETDLFIEAFCSNRRSAEYTLGLNSLTFTSSATQPADVIALAATPGNTGRVEVPTTGNMVGVFSVAVSNIGADAVIQASADTGGRAMAVQNIEICQTNPTTGACITTRAASTQVTLLNGGTATFGVFVRGTGAAIDNDPARNRVFVRFTDIGGERGATSVAVRTP